MNRRLFTFALGAAYAYPPHVVAGSAFLTLTASAEPLRHTFNKDVGKTRILMLVSPT